MISVSSINEVAPPSLATIKKTTTELLDRWQDWSDRYFAGKYRDAAETAVCILVLLICAVALRAYVVAKVALPITFSYWLAVAKQRFLVESGLWLEQLAYELLPIVQCDLFWRTLEQDVIARRQILDYELRCACSAEAC